MFFKVDPSKEPLTFDCAPITPDFTTSSTMTITAQTPAITNTDNLDPAYNCFTNVIT